MAPTSTPIPLQPLATITGRPHGNQTTLTSTATATAPGHVVIHQAGTSAQATTHPPSNAGQSGQNITATSPAAPRTIWERLKLWSTWLMKILLAVAGIVATYIALSVTMWTSIKDYRDDCRSQNISLDQMTQQCQFALSKPLSKPPLWSVFGDKVRRSTPVMKSDDQPLAIFILDLVSICIVIWVVSMTKLPPRMQEDSQPPSPISTTPSSWVGNAVPRIVQASMTTPSLGEITERRVPLRSDFIEVGSNTLLYPPGTTRRRIIPEPESHRQDSNNGRENANANAPAARGPLFKRHSESYEEDNHEHREAERNEKIAKLRKKSARRFRQLIELVIAKGTTKKPESFMDSWTRDDRPKVSGEGTLRGG